MSKSPDRTSNRKQEHIDYCLTDEISFKEKTTGFERYEFLHNAVTEIDPHKIKFTSRFLGKKINYPFLISCMTGGTSGADSINLKLSEIANELNIPVGVGSQRQALEDDRFHNSYKAIRQKAPKVPVLGNIGAAQLVQFRDFSPVRFLIDLVEADAIVVHLNAAQEIIQPEGEPSFKGLLKAIKKLSKEAGIPVIAKEVGAGISGEAARQLLHAGVKAIDVAGAGGTSWTAVEILRSKSTAFDDFWNWGIPTSFCIHEVKKLKKKYNFTLIGSGGINSAMDMAKAFALGADITASARIILQELHNNGSEGVINLIQNWFDTLRNVMFLTGSGSLRALQHKKLIRKELLF